MTAGMTIMSSPLLCICVYFCCYHKVNELKPISFMLVEHFVININCQLVNASCIEVLAVLLSSYDKSLNDSVVFLL